MAVGITRTQRVLLRGALRCMVLFGLLVVFLQIANAVGDGVLSRSIDVADGDRVGLRQRGVYVYESAVRVDLDHASTQLWVESLLPTVLLALAVAAIGFMLLRVFHETDAGQPFFDSSARRLRVVSAVIAVAAIVVPLAAAFADSEVLAVAQPRLETGGPDVAAVALWLVIALVVRVIAEAFRIGTQLRDDTEGLV
ncbi:MULTISPECIES: DUF2975 domain-containing protein [unclassified Nocardioides]|uniref:DUF2975 domain-containing protein n=1 Tax=unclassified Nocardioides TaxID=2615069 RepID=UPI0009F0F5AA|nr:MULTISPECIES: DUF2975 domain-containing protein [unclassified Nocardioides]GAW47837.1 hypothetical protein PD653B2_0147 [Nocardioides sp. PD653-B2]GAW53529.1 hypothetical protein PD653_0928 [Nocardioides sp. PD653]